MEFRFEQVSESSRVEISKSALLHNLRTIKAIIGSDVDVLAVVKACAYGHGYEQVVEILRDEKIRFFGVHSIDEARFLSTNKPDLPVLILGYIPFAHLEEAVSNGWRITLFNADSIKTIAEISARTGNTASVHIKLETGTNRQGINESDLPAIAKSLNKHPGIVVEGVSMHFANIEDTTDHSFARKQLDSFNRILQQLQSFGITPPIRHAASSAASLLFSDTHFDMIRFGISMYGLWPSKETYLSYLLKEKRNSLLKPVLSWKSIVCQVKDVPSGEYIGYGCTYRTTTDSRIAIVPVGYYDGYDRKLSNIAHVLIHGRRAPVRGRVCMDMFMVDVTHIPEVKLEDEVVLIGKQGDEVLSADQLADWAGTINYEIVSRINPLLPRVIVD